MTDTPEMPEKFVSWGTKPTEHQREIVTVLIEEAAEVQHRATKLLRFGGDEIQPGQPLTNIDRLSAEVGDFLETVDWCLRAGTLTASAIDAGRAHKRRQLTKYLQTAPPPASNICPSCKRDFPNGGTCIRGGCPMGGDL
jgi:hypothetical protein